MCCRTLSRRAFVVAAAIAAANPARVLARQPIGPDTSWGLPIRNVDGIPGDGFLVRHGFACENTWYYLGKYHCAEDWYRLDDEDSAGAEVIAVHPGEVMWIGSDYPGRVVLVLHADGMYAMYGHLDYGVDVVEGQTLERGEVIGRVLAATNWRAPNHLHFEIRTFFFQEVVNGDAPRYDYACGERCPPGPGYWPFEDAAHPAEMGWRNPMHVVHTGVGASDQIFETVVTRAADGLEGALRVAPRVESTALRMMTLRAGDRYFVTAVETGEAASMETSSLGYRVWYRIQLMDGTAGWMPAVIADTRDLQADGRPASVRPILVPTGQGTA